LGLAASSASAAYEQTGIFAGSLTPPKEPGVFPEDVQLGGLGGMAVNINGVGGVSAGTVYAATVGEPGEGTVRIAMFEPSGTSLAFSEGWEVTAQEEPYERCGPLLATKCKTRVESRSPAVDVNVDQATGNVYVFSGDSISAGGTMVTVFKADGSEVIARFGEKAPAGVTTASTPDKIHESPLSGAIAVNAAGEVYVFDVDPPADNFYHRLMVFKPEKPGDYEHYVYAGQEHDIGAGFFNETNYPEHPVADSAGHIYTAEEENIEEYDPTHPANPPICSFKFAKAGITSMTVNPANGEVFFFGNKAPKRIHRLAPCDEEMGEFVETEAFKASPERDDLFAMAFDPARQVEPSRAPGVLYGGAPRAVPFSGGKGEPGQSSLGYVFAHPKELAPSVEAESFAHVTSTSATLEARIDPRGSQTSYAFQYITEAEYEANEPAERFAGAAEAPPGGAVLGQEAAGVNVAVSGLLPDTGYHFRAVATSHCSTENPAKVCQGLGADQAFRAFPSEAPALPDKRAWELVSPADKHGGQVLPADPLISSCSGECKPGLVLQHFPMQSRPDGEAIVYEGMPFSPSEGAVIENEYLARRDEKAGWQTTNLTPPLLLSKGGGGYKAFDAGLGEGVLEQQPSPSLSPEAPSGYPDLYLQPTAEPLALDPLLRFEAPHRLPGNGFGSLRLAYVGASADLSHLFFSTNDALSEETPFAPEAVDGGEHKNNLYEWADGQLALVNVLPGNTETKPGASFSSGNAQAISADGSRAFWSDEAGQVYVRENGESTEAIPDPGKFLAASTDGSKVLLDSGHVYDLESEASADLSEGKGGFQGLVGQGEDLSHLYFIDTAVLTGEEENDQGAKAQAGKDNLYAWDEGVTVFVGTLLSDDAGDWSPSPSRRTAEASPDGRWITFLSAASLAGYDNIGPCPVGFNPIGPCAEAFLYDSATQTLTCASCNPSGERPLGRSVLRLIRGAEDSSLPQPRYLTDEGRLYFDSEDSLVPSDTNEGVEDVYQYEPGGVGTCEREEGCISLISAGHEAVDSNFLAMDEDGTNVFFTSRDQLSQKDHDQLIDLYDAREGGGIPGETETARTECQGEACQATVNAPNDPTPGSSSFEGAGNVNEAKAKKHKKKHAKKHKSHKRSQGRAAKHNRGGGK
jgi:hypothetical protein